MLRDMRNGVLYREAEDLIRALRQPGSGFISDASDVSTNGTEAAYAGTLVDTLSGTPPTRICLTHLLTGDTRVLTFGPNIDRAPSFSPDGKCLAFLSDRHRVGDYQLYLLDPVTGVARRTPRVDGWVEYLHWSPDGNEILLGVADHGADLSGGQGAVTSERNEEMPTWIPRIEAGEEDSHRWRSVWVYEAATQSIRRASRADQNVWEAVWCGNGAIAAVISTSPGEGAWYTSRLHIVDAHSGESREIYRPKDQIGWPSSSPSGRQVAIVEAVSSDRWVVAGDLRVFNTQSGENERVDTQGTDITHTEWRSDRHLLIAGHRGFETVVGLWDAESGTFAETWRSAEITTGGFYVKVSGLNDAGDCVLVGEGFRRPPEIAVIRQGGYQTVRSFATDHTDHVAAVDAVEQVTWNAPDGLEIQAWLLLPKGKGRYPLIMNVHGGPVWHWRPAWLGRGGATLMLIKHGYAVLFPNPRGSSGRGQDFARRVVGDMGGADTHDLLSGLDYLARQGVADPDRLGVMGGSYGGFMTSWLITQDTRFAAAVSVAPVTNQVTEHLISNIPHFVSLFLGDTYTNAGGKYFERSPVMHTQKVRTPTLNICGALDRCTPPEEAMQFHNALIHAGVSSVLLIYPEEGHGVRKWPAAIDYAARVVAWFEENMPAQNKD